MFEGTNQIHLETALTLHNVMFGEETQTNFYTIMGVFHGRVHHLLFNNGFIKAAQKTNWGPIISNVRLNTQTWDGQMSNHKEQKTQSGEGNYMIQEEAHEARISNFVVKHT